MSLVCKTCNKDLSKKANISESNGQDNYCEKCYANLQYSRMIGPPDTTQAWHNAVISSWHAWILENGINAIEKNKRKKYVIENKIPDAWVSEVDAL